MNAVEIEEAVTELAEKPFDAAVSERGGYRKCAGICLCGAELFRYWRRIPYERQW